MPIYEFYCPDCHTIYNFFSRRINTETTPMCPDCKKDSLSRKVSKFAVVKGGRADTEGGDDPLENIPIDESKMESAMASLANEAEGLNEDDPRAAAQLMRKFSDMTGLQYGDNMEEALSRLESGEEPDAIEEQMGDMLEGDENPFILPGGKKKSSKAAPPKRDEKLYEM